ncbi:MAG: hypothetical protein ACOY71_10075 [Gemmatimonadota bacterium]
MHTRPSFAGSAGPVPECLPDPDGPREALARAVEAQEHYLERFGSYAPSLDSLRRHARLDTGPRVILTVLAASPAGWVGMAETPHEPGRSCLVIVRRGSSA